MKQFIHFNGRIKIKIKESLLPDPGLANYKDFREKTSGYKTTTTGGIIAG
jgi:hypothetical protein